MAITKADFLNAVFCPACGWLEYHNPHTISVENSYRIREGGEVGALAREMYDGILVDKSDFEESLIVTQRMLQSAEPVTIFEAAFRVGKFVTRVDILSRDGSGRYTLLEVKSSTNCKPAFIDDMAYTTMVLQKNGVELQRICLLLLSKEYRLGMFSKDLFAIPIDCTQDVLERAKQFGDCCQQVEENLLSENKASGDFGLHCRKCPHINNDCQFSRAENHIFDLPRLSSPKFNELHAMEVEDIAQIPEDYALTPMQKRVHKSVVTAECVIEKGLKGALSEIQWPAHYLDFETMSTAIPIYPDIVPFAQVPTQFSVHKSEEIGVISKHFEYLADHRQDCREELIVSLLNALGRQGSIIIYTAFEKRVITGLAEFFSQYKNDLIALIDRMIDLEVIVRNNFYHPKFRGSTSIKKVLPALVPDLSYDTLEISNGDLAMVQFARMAKGECGVDEIDNIRSNLLKYCCQDTLAMVKLHDRLYDYALSENLPVDDERKND